MSQLLGGGGFGRLGRMENNNCRRVVLAGNILLDVVKRIDAWPEQGHLAKILDQQRACGGSVCNSGVFLKTLDPSIEVCACGKVGADEYGAWLRTFLEGKGLDVSRVRETDAAPTSYTDVMSVAATGERTFFHARGANALFTPDDIDLDALGCDLFHLGYLLLLDGLDAADPEYGTVAARLLHDVQARGIPTSLDLVSEQSDRFARIVRPALKYCDYLVVNEFEGEQATGISCRDASGKVSAEALRRIAEALLALGVRRSVTLHCPDMGVTLTAEGEFAAVESLKLPPGWIKGAVGAGDAFCAGMLYSLATGLPLADGLALAAACAAANLAAPDSVSGALPLAETRALIDRFHR